MKWWRRGFCQWLKGDGTPAPDTMAHDQPSREDSLLCRRCAGTPTSFLPSAEITSSSHPWTAWPDAAAATLAECLDLETLVYVAYIMRLPSFRKVFQRRARRKIPPDAARSSMVLVRTPQQRQQHQRVLFPTQFAVVDTYHLHPLYPLRDHVHALGIDPRNYVSWPELPLQCEALAIFPQLVHLEISSVYDHPIDLHELARCVPQLEKLTIQNATQLVNTDPHGMLDRLQTLYLFNTNIDSFSIAVGLPRLTSLTLLHRSKYRLLRDVRSLAKVAPLTTLVMLGTLTESSRAAFRPHVASSRTFGDLDRISWRYHQIHKWRAPPLPSLVASMLQLTSLRLGSNPHSVSDLRSLRGLKRLTHLQIVMSSKATHCRPLRELVTLRELEIARAWVCDIVGFLPELQRLVCETDVRCMDRARLCRRRHNNNSNTSNDWSHGFTIPPRLRALRQLVLYGGCHAPIDDEDPVVRAMLHSVEQLEVRSMRVSEPLMRSIERLPHLKRLAFCQCHHGLMTLSIETMASASSCLEELFVSPADRPLDTRGEDTTDEKYPVCVAASFLRSAHSLRVLACPRALPLHTLSDVAPRLTHLLTPFDTTQYQSFGSLLGVFTHLRVVALSFTQSCEPLRRARGPGRALPQLQCILHPTADCLWSPRCLRKHVDTDTARRCDYQEWVASQVSEPAWATVMITPTTARYRNWWER